MSKSSVLNMTQGSIMKQIVIFALPILGGNIFQELYNVVDTLIVGKTLGVSKLAAVGSTGPLLFFVISFIIGLASGCSVITSQKFGADDTAAVKKSIAAHIIISALLTITTTLVITLNTGRLLNLLQTNKDIYNDAYTYIFIMFAAMPGAVLYNFLASSLRAVGDSKTPLLFIIFSSVLNIILDLFFIIVCKWDVAGAAYATAVAMVTSGILCAIVIWKRTPILIPERASWRNLDSIIWEELKIGIPMGIQLSVIAVGFIVLQYVLNGFGSVAVAAFTVGSRVQSLMINPIASMGVVMATYVGQNFGAKKWDRILLGVRKSLAFTALFTIVMGLLVWLLNSQIIHMFIDSNEAQVEAIARQFLAWSCPLVWTLTFVFVTRGALQGLGDGVTPMLGGFLELIMRVAIPLSFSTSLGYTSVCIASPAAWIACGVTMTVVLLVRIHSMHEQTAASAFSG